MLLNFVIDKDGFRCINASDVLNTDFVSYLKCHFDFKLDAWKSVTSTVAIFKSATYNVTAEVLLDSNNDCYIDPEVYRRGGIVQCKLVGDRYKSSGEPISSSHITDILEFEVNNNITIPTPTPSKYDVFVAEYELAKQSVIDVIDDVQRRLDNGDFIGADGVGISFIVFNSDGTCTVTLDDGRSFTSGDSMKGDSGEDGVGITDVVYGEDGTLIITLTDGTTFTSEYSMRGERGPQGDPGRVWDVRSDDVSLVDNHGTANIPVASAYKYGLLKITDKYTSDNYNCLALHYMEGSNIKVSDVASPALFVAGKRGLVPAPPTSTREAWHTLLTADGAWKELAVLPFQDSSGCGYNMIFATTTGQEVLGIPLNDATSQFSGLMSSADKAKLDAIPVPPSADGSYILSVTVTNGVPTYSWILNQ